MGLVFDKVNLLLDLIRFNDGWPRPTDVLPFTPATRRSCGSGNLSLRFEPPEHIAVRDYYRAENPIAFAIRSVDPHLSAGRRGPIPLPR